MDNDKEEYFGKLTWGGLASWAGDVVFNRGSAYQEEGRVSDLAFEQDGGLIAWVAGTKRYATSVDVINGQLVSRCSCPYGYRCKHAVAVVLQYADSLKNKVQLETVTGNDPRLVMLENGTSGVTWGAAHIEAQANGLDARIDDLQLEELRDILRSLADLYPDVRKFLENRFLLSSGDVGRIVAATEAEIHDLSSHPGWKHHWDSDEDIPDYSEVRRRLEMLLTSGHTDEVMRLGETLLKEGVRQVEESDDEGETEEEIASCMDVVFRALPLSGLSTTEKMEWAVTAELKDEYDMTRGSEKFWEKNFERPDWSALADSLLKRLEDSGKYEENSFPETYNRDRLTDWIIMAMENSGRDEESLSLCRSEAGITNSYVRLVEKLIEKGMNEEAEEWIRRGVAATADSLPGIAHELRDLLLGIREEYGDRTRVASLLAEEFIETPGKETYEKLKVACENAGVWSQVRKHILHFLETGKVPTKSSAKSWPLPETGLKVHHERFERHFPIVEELIEVAIIEDEPSEVLRWYDYSTKDGKEKQYGWNSFWGHDIKVARAVFDEFQDRSISIWKNIIEGEIAGTNARSYAEAVDQLAELGKLMQGVGRKGEWDSYVSLLRQTNARKPRFLKTLDRISGKRIIDP